MPHVWAKHAGMENVLSHLVTCQKLSRTGTLLKLFGERSQSTTNHSRASDAAYASLSGLLIGRTVRCEVKNELHCCDKDCRQKYNVSFFSETIKEEIFR